MIGFLRGNPASVRALEDLWESRKDVHVSVPILYELYKGVARSPRPSAEERRIERLGELFRMLPFDRKVARLAGRIATELRGQGRTLPDLDILIAANAIVWGDATVMTSDARDFRRMSKFGLRVVSVSAG